MEEGKLVRWLKKEGDRVEKDEILLELETDKALVELPSPAAGTLRKILIYEGTVPVDKTIAYVGDPQEPIPEVAPATSSQPSHLSPAPRIKAPQTGSAITGQVRATPAARRRANELGINLRRVRGTGPEGRITQEDVEDAACLGALTTASPGTMRLGIESFSYHRYFGETGPYERPLSRRWDIFDFVMRAAELGAEGVSLENCYFASTNGNVLARLRDTLDAAHLDRVLAWGHPDGLKMGRSAERIESLREHLRSARRLGAKVMRIVAGHPAYCAAENFAARLSRLAPILRSLASEAADHDITLALENHGDFTSQELLALLTAVGHASLQVNFDTGNTLRVGEDPEEAARRLAERTACVHLKDVITLEESRGNPTAFWPSVPLGRGEIDLPAVLATLHRSGFHGLVCIEMANMHPDWPDEDQAVAESVERLRAWLNEIRSAKSPAGEA